MIPTSKSTLMTVRIYFGICNQFMENSNNNFFNPNPSFNNFHFSGKFLVAGEPCQGNKSERVAFLKRENSTGMQLWKIEPAKKKIKLENQENPIKVENGESV
jgi:hypothetical protein